jgi:AcrR family transcriptional regulator
MSMRPRPYRARTRSTRADATRERIRTAVHELLAEGRFHESSVELVAERAGVSRATLYQHFRSRLELVDGICETFDANPALLELRDVVESAEAPEALARWIANTVRFWSSEDAVLEQLYDVAAVDAAARDLVERQRGDRRSELERLVAALERSGRLRGTAERALALLLVLTAYDTFRELRIAGKSDDETTRLLSETAAELLLERL